MIIRRGCGEGVCSFDGKMAWFAWDGVRWSGLVLVVWFGLTERAVRDICVGLLGWQVDNDSSRSPLFSSFSISSSSVFPKWVK